MPDIHQYNNKQSHAVTGVEIQPSRLLSVGFYKLSFKALENISLPAYEGSAWRGVFGHALKKTVCVTRERLCTDCMLYRNCPYSYIFETPPPADTDRMKRYTAAPHPFVIFPLPMDNRTVQTGKELYVELIVFGRANTFLPYIVYAFRMAGQQGIGNDRGKFELIGIEQNTKTGNTDWQSIWKDDSPLTQKPPFIPELLDCPGTVLLEFQNPMRLKRDERLVGPKEFAFHDLFRNLLRRIAMLTYFHEKTSLDVDFAGLADKSRNVNILKKNLGWQDWTRYSSRQKTAMQMGGLIGSIELNGDALQPFWPFLWLGQWTHAGKGASMGLGRYRINSTASLPEQTEANG